VVYYWNACQVLWVRIHCYIRLFTYVSVYLQPDKCADSPRLTIGTSPVSWLYHCNCGDTVSGLYKNNFKIYLADQFLFKLDVHFFVNSACMKATGMLQVPTSLFSIASIRQLRVRDLMLTVGELVSAFVL
jgi:hypothetical protein